MNRRSLCALLAGLVLALPAQSQAAVTFDITISSRKIVVFNDDVSESEKTAVLNAASTTSTHQLDRTHTRVIATDAATTQKLIASGKVKRVEDDIRAYALGRTIPQIIPWGVARVNAPQAWPRSTGAGVKVAVIDTGIDLTHPDLMQNLQPGVNIITPSRSPNDDNGHGTHVAGIIGAVNNDIGTVGVAVDALIYPVKVLDWSGRGYVSDIIQGIDWAITQHVDVINLSLGTEADIASLHEAIDRAHAAGIVIVAAAGNSGGDVLYPAHYDGVIAVGMTDDQNQVSRYSSRGATLDVVAPGVTIYSTYRHGRYRTETGTSMASPHVSGLAALLRAYPPACDTDGDHRCSPDEVEHRIESTAIDLLTPGRDDVSGAGLVNAQRALGL